MNLNTNLFRPSKVVAREFEFPEGKAVLHLKTLSAMEFSSLCSAFASPDISTRAEAFAWAIKHSLCDEHGNQADEKGNELITLEQVKQLRSEPFGLILNAVMEINGADDSKH